MTEEAEGSKTQRVHRDVIFLQPALNGGWLVQEEKIYARGGTEERKFIVPWAAYTSTEEMIAGLTGMLKD